MAHRDGRGWLATLSAGAMAALLAGCTGLGPARVGIDRTDYTERLRESEKEQLLANIVALRYGDAPMFLGVSSVISQYTRESSGELHAAIAPAVDNDAGSIGGAVVLRETPTVTYTPVTGERFSRHLLAPLREAIRRECKVRIGYTDEKGATTERLVWPIALAFYDDRRTVAAWCELRSGFRHFRTDRIGELHATGDRYPKRRAILIADWRREHKMPGSE